MKTTAKSILVMGVSGSGKSHIGRQLAAALGATFIDGDDHHGPDNIAKMSRGEPLDDHDRASWLATLSDLYRDYRDQGRDLIIGCSALKRGYRDQLRQAAPDLKILYLSGSRRVLLERLESRGGHFFAGSHMLDSQLATLEAPGDDEAIRVDIQQPPRKIVEHFLASLTDT
ncbi:gluconokinase [Halomonas organivorans]|uniref:Gluconokinase n=1 Tax=Halomonas organivorans TaxID=257772 RepID=A0A7W5G797_9GAMM|nr:gluconokinase [Halomonas organivorans]MBB3142266.1 gluconokinase [Halomonas organivorans]